MIGVRTFELGIGFPLAAQILPFVFRGQVLSLVLVLLVLVLAPILGSAIAVFLAYILYALFRN